MRLRARLAAAIFTFAPSLAGAAPAMWEVSDADSRIVLLGSMHVLPKDLDWRTPLLDETMKSSEQVYFEADIGPLGQVGIILKSLALGFTNAQNPWTQRLSTTEAETVSSAIKPLGLTLEQLGAYPPWLAQSVIDDKVMGGIGLDVEHGVDLTLQNELPKEKKAYFESAGEQMDMLAKEAERAQIDRLLADVGTIDHMPADLKDMVAAWAAGNLDAIAVQMTDDPSLDAAFAENMLFDRNKNWVEAIKGLLAGNHQDLIVVGAAHLIGDGSVTDLLAKAGYTVTRIQ